MKSTISEKGQVTIPKKLRDSLGLRAGQTLDFEEFEGKIIAKRIVDQDPIDRMFGILSSHSNGMTSDDFLTELRGPGFDELMDS